MMDNSYDYMLRNLYLQCKNPGGGPATVQWVEMLNLTHLCVSQA